MPLAAQMQYRSWIGICDRVHQRARFKNFERANCTGASQYYTVALDECKPETQFGPNWSWRAVCNKTVISFQNYDHPRCLRRVNYTHHYVVGRCVNI